MSLRVRWALVLAVALAALVLAAPAPAADAPSCLTPLAPHEPPCNPHLADSPWSASHRGSYASGSSPFAGPRPGDTVTWQHVRLPGSVSQVPIVIDFTAPYPDGGRAAWMSVVSSPDVEGVHKVDAATGEVIGSVTSPPKSQNATITGAYNLLDRDHHFFVGRQRSLDVFGDTQPGKLRSPIAKLKSLALPDSALCGSADKLVGITMTYDGHVVYASERGAVGVVPRSLDTLDAKHLEVLQLNAGHCDASDAAQLEIVSNSISADEDGGIYVVTSKAMHQVRWDGTRLRAGWTGKYETGNAGGGVRLGDGSGSTPDVMGTSHDSDRFVVITDGQDLMHLVLFWRDAIPAGWKAIAPGKDPRIACEVPVTFGDPAATRSSSEQSVLTNGYASVVVNNALKDESAFASLPAQQRQIAAALAGQDPANAPYGMERIDWDPATRKCRSVWANREVSIPNGIPTLSTSSGLVYGQGQRDGAWGLEGLNVATGKQELRVAASPGPDSNSIYAATEVGPDGAIWQGTGGGIDIYRGPRQPVPESRCFDLEPPVLGRVRMRAAGRTRVRLSGTASDTSCGQEAVVGVRVKVGGTRSRPARVNRGRWTFTVRRPRTRRTVRVFALDASGLTSRTRRVTVRGR